MARTSGSPELVVASHPEDYFAARALFSEYASQLGVDLCFQNFSAELERLPEMYGHPGGRLILAQKGRAIHRLRRGSGPREYQRRVRNETAIRAC